MPDRWIVTTHQYVEHSTFEKAEAERERLAKKHPDRSFRIVRVRLPEVAPAKAE